MNKRKKIVSFILASLLAMSALSGCGTGTESTSKNPDTGKNDGKTTSLAFYMYGETGPASKDLEAEINKKMAADINATIDFKYIDWADVSTKYPLIFASGEKFDMAYASTTAPTPYNKLAKEGALTDITDMLDAVPDLKKEIPEKSWEVTKVDGKIYGVPSDFSEYTHAGVVYRTDLYPEFKEGSIKSFDDLDAYLTKYKEETGKIPLNGDIGIIADMYRLFVGSTDKWIYAPGIAETEQFLAVSYDDDYKNVFSPVFTDEFADFVVKMKSWSDKGFWSTDIMSAKISAKDNFNNELSAAYTAHMPDWTGAYKTLKDRLPDAETDFWSPITDNHKILNKASTDNTTVISSTSAHPEKALQAIEKFMTDESYYRLLQNGIEGRRYEIENGVVVPAKTYDPAKDDGGFAAWALRTDKLNLPNVDEDPRRQSITEEWKKEALDSPYAGFAFDPKNISTELSAVTNINQTLGRQLLSGKTQEEPLVALETYRKQLKDAGIDKVIDEVKAQLDNFTPVK